MQPFWIAAISSWTLEQVDTGNMLFKVSLSQLFFLFVLSVIYHKMFQSKSDHPPPYTLTLAPV